MNQQTNQTTIPVAQGAAENLGTQPKAPTAVLFDASSKERFNPSVRDELISFIRTQMRSGEGIYKKLFNYVRQCGDYSTAVGTIHGAERQVCKDEKVKNLNQLNKARDMSLSSYITVKSTLLSAVEKAEDLAEERQALLDWVTEFEGAEKVILQPGYLDVFSDLYADPVKGAATFRKHANEAKAAAATLQQKKAAYDRAKEKAAQAAQAEAAKTGTVEQTPAQVRSGGGVTEVKLPETWVKEINNLKGILVEMVSYPSFKDSEAAKKVPTTIERCTLALDQLFKDFRAEQLAKASEHASRPSEAVAASQGAPELPEVSTDEPELTEEDMANIQEIEGTGTHE